MMSEVVSADIDIDIDIDNNTMNDQGGGTDSINNYDSGGNTVDNNTAIVPESTYTTGTNNNNNEQQQQVQVQVQVQLQKVDIVVPIDIRTMPLPPLRAQELLHSNNEYDKKIYWDRSHYDNLDKQLIALSKSCTLYVGNLNFTTRTVHVYNHFSIIGTIDKIIIGMDRFKKIPCGFCFVTYYCRKHAIDAVSLLSGTKLDGSIIRVELDAGYKPGRQFGRGQSGGQVRHDRKAALALQQANGGANQWQFQQQAPTSRFSTTNNNRGSNNSNNYNVGDKRNRSNSYTSNTQQISSSSDVNRERPLPTMDGALPTGRKQQDSIASTGPIDTTTTTTENQNNMDDPNNNNNDTNNEDAPPSKRQKT